MVCDPIKDRSTCIGCWTGPWAGPVCRPRSAEVQAQKRVRRSGCGGVAEAADRQGDVACESLRRRVCLLIAWPEPPEQNRFCRNRAAVPAEGWVLLSP